MYKQLITESYHINNHIDFSSLQNKSVLLTGATGIMGIFFLLSLKNVSEKYNISITAWINRDLPSFLIEIFRGIKIIKGDITVPYIDQSTKYDVIIHSAGYGQPSKFLLDEVKTIQINTYATEHLLNRLKENGKFLFISSSEVYNGLDDDNIVETVVGRTNTDHPRSCYIEGKRCGESICHAHKKHGVDVKIARLCLAYGPGIRKDDVRVVNELITKGLMEGKITLRDSGDATRTYCYATDAVIMMWNILLFGKNVIYNIGGKQRVSILELASKIGEILNLPIVIPENQNPLIGNPKNVNISCERYYSEFGDVDFKDINHGLTQTIVWIKNII